MIMLITIELHNKLLFISYLKFGCSYPYVCNQAIHQIIQKLTSYITYSMTPLFLDFLIDQQQKLFSDEKLFSQLYDVSANEVKNYQVF
jgi:hypothetical protein